MYSNLSQNQNRQMIASKLKKLLEILDADHISGPMKIWIYEHLVAPKLSWDLMVYPLSITWVEENLDAPITRYLKKWSGLARSASTTILYRTNKTLDLI